MPLGLPALGASLLAHGPTTEHTVHYVDAPPARAGAADRQRQLDELTGAVRAYVARAPFWPGGDLVEPPRQPATLPYRPYAN